MADKEVRMTPVAIAALVRDDFANFIAASTPGGIEAQEARGQQTFVSNTRMPVKFNVGTRMQAEAMGIEFGGQVDDLFMEAKLPEGWRKEATGHSMWSKLIDGRGRERATVFYKAAFYDREAFTNLTCRYGVSQWYGETGDDYDHDNRCMVVRDRGNDNAVLYRTTPFHKHDYEASDTADIEVRAWISTNFPEYKNASAYWDSL